MPEQQVTPQAADIGADIPEIRETLGRMPLPNGPHPRTARSRRPAARSRLPPVTAGAAPEVRSGVVEEFGGHRGLGIGYADIFRTPIRHREQTSNTACHSIFRHRWVGELAEFLQRCLAVLDA